MTEFENLPHDLKNLINSHLTPYYSNNLRATDKSNRTLTKTPLYYSTNNIHFIKAYSDALKFAGTPRKIPDLASLIAHYSQRENPTITLSNNRTYPLSKKANHKLQIYNKGILIYLQILKKGNYDHYIYGLALLISEKSCLTQKHKYRTIEFELYKLYVMSYLIKPTQHYDMKYLTDASYMIKHYSKVGIPGYVSVASDSQLLCATFIRYYFNKNPSTYKEFNDLFRITTNPFIITNETDIYEQCMKFMIEDGGYYVSPKLIDLSLIE